MFCERGCQYMVETSPTGMNREEALAATLAKIEEARQLADNPAKLREQRLEGYLYQPVQQITRVVNSGAILDWNTIKAAQTLMDQGSQNGQMFDARFKLALYKNLPKNVREHIDSGNRVLVDTCGNHLLQSRGLINGQKA